MDGVKIISNNNISRQELLDELERFLNSGEFLSASKTSQLSFVVNAIESELGGKFNFFSVEEPEILEPKEEVKLHSKDSPELYSNPPPTEQLGTPVKLKKRKKDIQDDDLIIEKSAKINKSPKIKKER